MKICISIRPVVSLVILALATFNMAKAQFGKRTFEVEGHNVNIRELNNQIGEILHNSSLPGLSLAVIDKDEVVFYNTYGYKKFKELRNGELKGRGKVNERTIFEACSLSKSFFVFAAHRLVDQGILNLDTPLFRYLEHPDLQHDNRYKKITARMVLTHSSGLENWRDEHNPDTLEIQSDPGENFVYSGEGYVYLSKVVEKLLGKDTDRYMKELVYEPLHLKRTFTTYSKGGSRPRNYAVGHDAFKSSIPKVKNESPNIAATISTTAFDYARLLIATFGGDYLTPGRLKELISSGTPLAENLFYGPGFTVFYDQTDTLVFQDGNNGMFKGFGGYNITKKSGFVMFVNGERGDQIRNILTELIFKVTESIDDNTQYPNLVFEILKIYNDHGYVTARNKFKSILDGSDQKFSRYELEELQSLFITREPEFSSYISEILKQQ